MISFPLCDYKMLIDNIVIVADGGGSFPKRKLFSFTNVMDSIFFLYLCTKKGND